jgi:hypothetical protein
MFRLSKTHVIKPSDLAVDLATAFTAAQNTEPKRSRNIANGMYVGTGESSDAQCMAVSVHDNRGGDITSIQKLVFANFYATATIAGEAGPGGSCTIEAAIEYPIGSTRTRITFGGSNSGTITDNSLLESDSVTITIPDGGRFRVWTWRNCSAGTVFTAAAGNATLGTLFSSGATVTNNVMSGTFSSTAASRWYGPICIVGLTARQTLVVIGDSRTFGTTSTYSSFDGWPKLDTGSVANCVGDSIPVLNLGRASDQAQFFVAASTNRRTLMQYFDHVAIALGVNDLRTGGRTEAQIKADLGTIFSYTQMLGKKRYAVTIEGYNTVDVDAWTTLVNQSLPAGETTRLALNTWIRTKPNELTGIVSVLDVSEAQRLKSTVEGKWPVNGTNYWATDDGLHGSWVFWDLVRAVGNITPSNFTP